MIDLAPGLLLWLNIDYVLLSPGGWALTGKSNNPSRSVVYVHRTYDVSLVRG